MKPNREVSDLHPIMREPVRNLMAALYGQIWRIGDGRSYTWAIFEGYRSAKEQKRLLNETASREAGPWKSSHQYGFAVDVVPCTADMLGHPTMDGFSWSEEHPWDSLSAAAQAAGLETPLAWDRAHVQHPVWKSHVRTALS